MAKEDSISASLYCCAELTEPPSITQSVTPEFIEPCVDIDNVLASKSLEMKNAKQLVNGLSNAEKYSYVSKYVSPPKVPPATYSLG